MPESDPKLPDIRLELVADESPAGQTGFLSLVRRRYRALYPDGTRSAEFVYDAVDRRAIDAVVIAAHYHDGNGRRVYLRSAVRPPLVLREGHRSPVPELDRGPGLWELPAGLVEPNETDRDGPQRSAARELEEELGFQVEAERMQPLGPSTYPAPGIIGERHFYFEVTVDPLTRHEPSHDGSALEHGGLVLAVELDRALDLCARGLIEDAKTELALRRLKERFSG